MHRHIFWTLALLLACGGGSSALGNRTGDTGEVSATDAMAESDESDPGPMPTWSETCSRPRPPRRPRTWWLRTRSPRRPWRCPSLPRM